jgi:hypothetical protein
MKKELLNVVASFAVVVGTMVAMYNVLIFMICK